MVFTYITFNYGKECYGHVTIGFSQNRREVIQKKELPLLKNFFLLLMICQPAFLSDV
jgi:hypothetical protein